MGILCHLVTKSSLRLKLFIFPSLWPAATGNYRYSQYTKPTLVTVMNSHGIVKADCQRQKFKRDVDASQATAALVLFSIIQSKGLNDMFVCPPTL